MEESEDLITVDAVGCFEDEDDDEEEEEGISADDTAEDPESFMVKKNNFGFKTNIHKFTSLEHRLFRMLLAKCSQT